MYTLHFTKMNGAGNDFVLLDNRAGERQLPPEIIARLCDRHSGVGADGVLVAEMPAANQQISFETPAGVIHAQLEGDSVRLAMSQPAEGRALGPLDARGEKLAEAYFINTGVPHVVVPVADVGQVDVSSVGRALRHHPQFAPRGANANFIQPLGPSEIALRTYERGVENETLACGTGATASALVYAETTGVAGTGSIAVRVRSGEYLHIGFDRRGHWEFSDVTLAGPADFVFEARINL
jgi:diaminopimelate epimerase